MFAIGIDDTVMNDRANWYRIPEREKQNFPLDSVIRANSQIVHARSIVRAGYYISPLDMPGEAATRAAIRILAGWLQEQHNQSDDWSSPVYMFKSALKVARGEWYRHEKKNSERDDLNLKTFWYVDHEKRSSWVMSRDTRYVGNYFPGQNIISCDGWTDYEPAVLSVKSHSVLARIEMDVFVHPLDIIKHE